MKNILKFIFFMTYLILIFFVKKIEILGLLFLFNFLWMKVLDMNFRKLMKNLKILLPFVLFTGVLNSLLDEWLIRSVDSS